MVKKIALVVAAALALLVLLGVAYTHSVSAPLFDEARGQFAPTIADPDVALTFARSGRRPLLVTAQDDRSVTGLDLTAALGEARTDDLGHPQARRVRSVSR